MSEPLSIEGAEGEEERVRLTAEELDAMMPAGDRVHTFAGGAGILLGCDMPREHILKAAREHGAELAGKNAAAMGHGAAVWESDGGLIFVETRKL